MMRRPKTLTVVMWFAGIYAVGAVLGIAAVAAGIGEPGVPVSRDAWLKVAAPLVATIAVLICLTSLGLRRHRLWARRPFIFIWPLIAVYGSGCGLVGAIPWSLVARAWIDALLFARWRPGCSFAIGQAWPGSKR